MSIRLRGRFTLWFGVAAMFTIVAAAAITREVVSSRDRAKFERALEAAEADARREVQAIEAQVTRAVDSLANRQNPFAGALLLELRKDSGDLGRELESAPTMMRLSGLDLLLLVGKDDTVLAAPHAIGKVDERDPRPRRLAREKPGVPVVVWDEVLENGKLRKVLVIEAARTVSDAGESITVLGGRRIGRELLGGLGGSGEVAARLTDAEGRELASTESSWERLARAPAVDLPLLGPDGKPTAHLIVAVPDDDLHRTLHAFTLATVALGVLGLVLALALGFFVSRRITSDLDALVGAAQAVSRGDLDHKVTVRARDEVGELASAFNAMTRELRESKERLVQAERLAAWQEIARSIAHEIKNPLTPIQMSVETMRKTFTAKHPSFDEIFEESTRTVLEEVQRLKKIVGEFSQFARLPKPERQACDLGEIVAGALALYRGAVKVVEELGGDLPSIDADRDQLTQVVLNLLENARDAIASRGSEQSVGRITIRTRARDAVVELEVEDNGPGFDPALRDKLFTPYFTTKEAGTGLGLAIVHRIVTDHGGKITAASAPGKGARFLVELPARR